MAVNGNGNGNGGKEWRAFALLLIAALAGWGLHTLVTVSNKQAYDDGYDDGVKQTREEFHP